MQIVFDFILTGIITHWIINNNYSYNVIVIRIIVCESDSNILSKKYTIICHTIFIESLVLL